jgi:hypothetical protein
MFSYIQRRAHFRLPAVGEAQAFWKALPLTTCPVACTTLDSGSISPTPQECACAEAVVLNYKLNYSESQELGLSGISWPGSTVKASCKVTSSTEAGHICTEQRSALEVIICFTTNFAPVHVSMFINCPNLYFACEV